MDTHLFLDILFSEGVRERDVRTVDGVTSGFYISQTGRKAQINSTDEFLPAPVIKYHLKQLGLDHLINILPLN